jgi:hypothetical protein
MATIAYFNGVSLASGNTATTPATAITAGELLVMVVFKGSSTNVGSVSDTLADGATWSMVRHADTSIGTQRDVLVFVRDLMTPSSASATLTYSAVGDDYTGVRLTAFRMTGMTLTGPAAIRQSGVQNDRGAASTPSPAFDSGVCLTTNPVLGAVVNSTNPVGITEPSGWTEALDASSSLPLGCEIATMNSGFTGSTVTWGNTSPSPYATIVVEFDATAAGPPTPTYLRHHRA